MRTNGTTAGVALVLGLAAGCGGRSEKAPAPVPTATTTAPAVLHYLASFDDEGVIQREIPSPSAPGPYFLDGVLYADAVALTGLLAPDTPVSLVDGTLVVNGERTELPARRHGAAIYVPVRDFARRFGAYTFIRGNLGTVWPRARLCEYRPRADPRAPVFQGAEAEGLFEGCPATRLHLRSQDVGGRVSVELDIVAPDWRHTERSGKMSILTSPLIPKR
ncbi:MAG TPA: hypothetical protein VHG28_10030 [Longimicrobiaceae bacterium]|nr:hypothetical protein [Longimicrobiaceae bacterium]